MATLCARCAVAGPAKEMTVDSAKNVAHDIKCLLTVSMHPHVSDFLTAQRTHVSSPHKRIFAGTHLETPRIMRLGDGTLRTAASHQAY